VSFNNRWGELRISRIPATLSILSTPCFFFELSDFFRINSALGICDNMYWDLLNFFYIGSNTPRFEMFFDSLSVVIKSRFVFIAQNIINYGGYLHLIETQF